MEPWLVGVVVGIVVVVVGGLGMAFAARRRRAVRTRELVTVWGSGPPAGRRHGGWKVLMEVRGQETADGAYRLDRQTWSDLDLDAVFSRMGHCVSKPGSQVLYVMLHEPLLDEQRLRQRWAVIDELRRDAGLRTEVGLALWPLGSGGSEALAELLWRPLPDRGPEGRAAPLLALAAVAVTGGVVLGQLPAVMLLGVFVLNTVLHFLNRRRTEGLPVDRLAVLAGVIARLADLEVDRLGSAGLAVKENAVLARRIQRRLGPLLVDDGLGLVQYLKIFFLVEVMAYGAVVRLLESFRQRFQSLLLAVGEVDALRAMASYFDGCPVHCEPEHRAPRAAWEVRGLVHPLLEDPVPYDFAMGRGKVLVTGSNMSGKTTFLKALGVNAVLAQVCHRALAASYALPLLRAVTSIGRADNLVEGKSYYMAEVESVERIVRAADQSEPHLMLLDEIFRGTNTVERIAAGFGVLSYLARGRHLVFVATHDGELVELLEERYDACHFSETVGEDGLCFDYTIRPGPSTRSNALALLELAGFPSEVTRRAAEHLR
ncbi:MAG: hypothetical protein GXP47_03470 [Acidobacteria bacterium]|nr:hypothetical protein [Acidobacteriota bacterium]